MASTRVRATAIVTENTDTVTAMHMVTAMVSILAITMSIMVTAIMAMLTKPRKRNVRNKPHAGL